MSTPKKAAPNHPHRIYLIDGSGYIFRAFHALPPMTRPDGTPVNAVYGFVNMLIKLLADTEAEGIAVIFDAARKTFRNKIYPAYKENRPPPEELIPQFGLIREATRAFNLPCIEMPDHEADDLIATNAKAARGGAVSSQKIRIPEMSRLGQKLPCGACSQHVWSWRHAGRSRLKRLVPATFRSCWRAGLHGGS